MKRLLANNWDMVLVRGILAALFGIATLFLPGITLIVLVALFGGYALIDGVMLVVLAFRLRNFEVKDDARQTNFRQAHQS